MYVDQILSGFVNANRTGAMNQLVQTEMNRQNAYAESGQVGLIGGIKGAGYDNALSTIAAGKDEALAGYKQAETAPYVTGNKNYTAEDSAQTNAASEGYAKRTNEAKASNQAYSNLSNQQTINAMKTGDILNINANEAKTSAGALSSELTQASTASSPMSDALEVIQAFDSSIPGLSMYASGSETGKNTNSSSSGSSGSMYQSSGSGSSTAGSGSNYVDYGTDSAGELTF